MIELRIEGKAAEVKALVFLLSKLATIHILEESREYANRPPSSLVRRYVKVEFREVAEKEENP